MASDSLLMLVEIVSILDLGQILEEVTGIVHPCNILRLIYFIFNLLDVTSYQSVPFEAPCEIKLLYQESLSKICTSNNYI